MDEKMISNYSHLKQIKDLWQQAHDELVGIPIKETDQWATASCYADALIGAVRGVTRHLEDIDTINAFRIMRTVLECVVKFKCILADASFIKQLEEDHCCYIKKLFNKARGSDGMGLEILKDKSCPISEEKFYKKLVFENLFKKVGWTQQYNLIFCHCSEVSHVSFNEILKTIKEKDDGKLEFFPYGETTHTKDYNLALGLMGWFAQQFSLLLKDFKKL